MHMFIIHVMQTAGALLGVLKPQPFLPLNPGVCMCSVLLLLSLLTNQPNHDRRNIVFPFAIG
jgi:hypothetical protein